jgi:hypothetical protein
LFEEIAFVRKTSRGFQATVIEGAISVFGFALSQPMLVPLLIRKGASVELLGIYNMALLLTAPISQLLFVFVLDRLRTKRLYLMTALFAIARFFSSSILFIIISPFGSIYQVIVLSLVSNMFSANANLVFSDLVPDLVEPSSRGRAFAARNAICALLTAAGFAISVYLFAILPYPENYVYSYAIGAFLMLVDCPIFLAYGDKRRPSGIGITPRGLYKLGKKNKIFKEALSLSTWSFSYNIAASIGTYHMFHVMGGKLKALKNPGLLPLLELLRLLAWFCELPFIILSLPAFSIDDLSSEPFACSDNRGLGVHALIRQLAESHFSIR